MSTMASVSGGRCGVILVSLLGAAGVLGAGSAGYRLPPAGGDRVFAVQEAVAHEHVGGRVWPGRPLVPALRVTTPALPPGVLRVGGFQSVQVNTDARGNNIVGDAANEPSIVVDPLDRRRMAIGWRQFATIESSFREAGAGYSRSGGLFWDNLGAVRPGPFRSDPVLMADPDGVFYYFFVTPAGTQLRTDLFISLDAGQSWSEPIYAFGGDKEWVAVDFTDGIGRGHLYQAWNQASACCEDRIFSRSVDGGQTWMEPIRIEPWNPVFGTLTVGPEGTLYIAGIDFPFFGNDDFVVAISDNAQDAGQIPEFDVVQVNMGGALRGSAGPNPGGLLGQAWIAADHSDGESRGNLYMLCSVGTPTDPCDVHFVRSEDGGFTWTDPVRLNDDAESILAWQWFGTMSVAPNGRIDIVWLDTRNDPVDPLNPSLSELFYTYSDDAGDTWSPNEVVTPPFNHFLGYPQQNKMGDYFHMVSDDFGADLAYAATFNGEQDVYYVRLGDRDCNLNGIADSIELDGGGADCNANGILDECEVFGRDCNHNGIPDDCDIAACPPEELDCLDRNGNGVPDGCEDCNGNGTRDYVDIQDGISDDCNSNWTPDECEVPPLWPAGDDCNENGVPDECDIAAGAPDCNLDGIPDGCEIRNELFRVFDPEGETSDSLGTALAVDGPWIVAGADEAQPVGADSGQVVVFRRSGVGVEYFATLIPADLAAGDRFGSSVAVLGDYLLAGAPGSDVNGVSSGLVYVYQYDGIAWRPSSTIAPDDATVLQSFGSALDADGNRAVVGASGDDGIVNNGGAAYVFRRDGGLWIQEAKLVADDVAAADQFGSALAISGDEVLVGVRGQDAAGFGAGAAYVFVDSDGSWTQQAKLIASDADSSDEFGTAVALHDGLAAIGAIGDDDVASSGGAVYLFERDGTDWMQKSKLTADDGGQGGRFGASVALDGARLVVGAPLDDEAGAGAGAAYVYVNLGTYWGHARKLLPRDGFDSQFLGSSAALSYPYIYVGAPRADGTEDGSGAVYVFSNDRDRDGFWDVCDNCPRVYNPDQGDADGDGTGDACENPLGDMNCDGVVNNFDIDPFVLALTSAAGYEQAYPDCFLFAADVNGDGVVNNFDIDPFVDLVTGQ